MSGSIDGHIDRVITQNELNEAQPGSPEDEDDFAAMQREIEAEERDAIALEKNDSTFQVKAEVLQANQKGTIRDIAVTVSDNQDIQGDKLAEGNELEFLGAKDAESELELGTVDRHVSDSHVVDTLLDERIVNANKAGASASKDAFIADNTIRSEAAIVRSTTKANIGVKTEMSLLSEQINRGIAQTASASAEARRTPEGQMALALAANQNRYLMLSDRPGALPNTMIAWDGKDKRKIVAIEEYSPGAEANVIPIAGRAVGRALAKNPSLKFHVVNQLGKVVRGQATRIMELAQFDRVYNYFTAIILERLAQKKLDEQRAAEAASRNNTDQNPIQAEPNKLENQKTQNDIMAWLDRNYPLAMKKMTSNFLNMLQELTRWASELNHRVVKRMQRQADKVREVHKRVDAEDLSRSRLKQDVESKEVVSRTDSVSISAENSHDGSRILTRTQTIRQGNNRVRLITSQSAKINGQPKPDPEGTNGPSKISRTRIIT